MATVLCHTVELWYDVHYRNVRSVLKACQFRTLFGVGAPTLLPVPGVSKHASFGVGAPTLLPVSGVSKHARVAGETSFTVVITGRSRMLAAVHINQ